MKRLLISIVILAVLAGAGTLLYKVATGPRMYHQENVHSYEALMPLPPDEAVPLNDTHDRLPDAAEAVSLRNPLPATPENIRQGKIYYSYYCRFCHGDAGRAESDVGNAYLPEPAFLDSDRIKGMSDGELGRAMLLGTGHEPVLERIVPAGAHWYISLFVRTFRHEGQQP